MAKFVYIYSKKPSKWDYEKNKIHKILGHIHAKPFLKSTSQELLWASTSEGLKLGKFQVTTGNFTNDVNQHTFKLSTTKEVIQLTSDMVASRTVWYFIDDEKVIVSSSQRAITGLLASLQLNEQAISWMMCTGSLGPGNSWDKRIKALKPAETISIRKKNLKATVTSQESPTESHKLKETFDNLFSSTKIDGHAGITLSGGWDSRAVAFNLCNQNLKPTAYTWGTEGALSIEGTDAFIAEKVAKELGLTFHFIGVNASHDSEKDFETFVRESEGRIDHVNSFYDGLALWKSIHSFGTKVIIRSDEAFGWVRVSDKKDTRISLDINTPDDYQKTEEFFQKASIQSPIWPNEFHINENESLSTWRDRLYRQYRIPYILAALQEPMLSFVEIVNPLLHQQFIMWAKSRDDNERTDKKAYKEEIKKWLGNIPIAEIPAIPEINDVLSKIEVYEVIKKTISRPNKYFVFNPESIRFLLEGVQTEGQTGLENSYVRRLKSIIPFGIKKLLRKRISGYKLGGNRLAFRAYIVMKMIEILESDINK